MIIHAMLAITTSILFAPTTRFISRQTLNAFACARLSSIFLEMVRTPGFQNRAIWSGIAAFRHCPGVLWQSSVFTCRGVSLIFSELVRHILRELNWDRKLRISSGDPTEFVCSGTSFAQGCLVLEEDELWWSGMIELLTVALAVVEAFREARELSET